MKRIWGFVSLLILSALIACPQSALGETPADKDDVQKLFATLHLREMMQNLMAVSMQQSKQMAHDALKKKQPNITDAELKRMDTVMDSFAKDMDFSGMLDDMVPVYQRHLTKEDVEAMLVFYESPTGQKLLREQPAMTAEGMQAMRPRMEKMMADVMEKAEKMAQEESSTPKPSEKTGN